jgi:hypothetical protein
MTQQPVFASGLLRDLTLGLVMARPKHGARPIISRCPQHEGIAALRDGTWSAGRVCTASFLYLAFWAYSHFAHDMAQGH